jgi:hypothetical protein
MIQNLHLQFSHAPESYITLAHFLPVFAGVA